MGLQADIIKTFCRHDAFETYSPFISKHHFQETDQKGRDYFWQMFSQLKEYHANHNADITVSDLRDLHIASLGGVSADKREALSAVYDIVAEDGKDIVEESGAARAFLELLQRQTAASKAITVLDEETKEPKAENWLKLQEIVEAAVATAEVEDKFYTTDLMEADEDYTASAKWKWFDPAFNAAVGGAGPERTALIVALTNVGKTSFTVFSNVQFMRDGAKVLHFAIAEDSKVSLMRRYYHAAFCKNDAELDADKNRYAKEFGRRFKDKLFLYPTDSLNLADAEQLIKEVKPDIVVFDDFKDLELGYKGDTKAPKIYGLLASRIKALAQKYQFFGLCCCQAADSARGKQQLTTLDIADSKVDIPSKFEYIIGLSRGEHGSDSFRFVSFPKNKKGKESAMFNFDIDEERCQWKK